MGKFQSSALAKPSLVKTLSGQSTIRETFQRLGTVEDRQRPGRPSQITEEKIDEVIGNEAQSTVRSVGTGCSIPPTTVRRNISH